MDRKSLGARIKAQRIKCGLSQEEFAEKLHCTSSHIGKVENGKVGVSIELLVSIANELQTTVDQLLQDSYDYMGKWRIGEPVLLYTECKQPIEKNA